MATKYAVAKVAGSDPEMFVVVGMDFAEVQIKSMSNGVSEEEMRKHLAEHGATDEEIENTMDWAKKNPK